jgi:hypothetical protein
MSAQTGRPSLPDGPPSSRALDRARARITRYQNDPNPVWIRELRQSARLSRTPIILAVVTGMVTLLMCSVGGVASVSAEPAKVGIALFHTFFSVAFSVVTWVGPAVAANTIASERGGRTWEALLLTGLDHATIARGKFLAALTYVSLYIVMLAPVGVLPFLFGGVTATEVLTAFVLLFWFAVLSVAFGLSISSKFSTPAVAIVVTLLVAIPLSMMVYVALGPLLSMAVHELWPSVPDGPPVWLPTAYVRADFGLQYLALLVLCPVAAVALPAWLLYEVTLANMAGPSDDRSSGLRRWFAVSAPLVCALCLLPGVIARSVEWQLAGTSCFIAFLLFAAFLFLGEPLGPSRRVRVHWQRAGESFRQRYFGPGILPASSLLFVVGVLGLLVHLAAGAWLQLSKTAATSALDAQRVGAFIAYLCAFFVFVVGFCVWARARALTSAVPRLLLLGVLFLASVGPWIAMAIAGIATQRSTSALIVAAPSPSYALVLVETLGSPAAERDLVLGAGAICAAAWALLGLGLYGLGRARTRKTLASYDAAHEQLEALLRSEDAQHPAAAAG